MDRYEMVNAIYHHPLPKSIGGNRVQATPRLGVKSRRDFLEFCPRVRERIGFKIAATGTEFWMENSGITMRQRRKALSGASISSARSSNVLIVTTPQLFEYIQVCVKSRTSPWTSAPSAMPPTSENYSGKRSLAESQRQARTTQDGSKTWRASEKKESKDYEKSKECRGKTAPRHGQDYAASSDLSTFF